jgi:ATP-binding protein involved in chromosome partitioning
LSASGPTSCSSTRSTASYKALEQFLSDVHWGELDTLFIDLPPGTGDITLSLLELLPSAALLVVTTPQQAARAVAARAGRMARELGMPLAGVIENMSTLVCARCGDRAELFGSGGGQRLAAELGTELLGQIPLDVALRQACDAGIPVVDADPAAASAAALADLAARLPAVRRSLVGIPLPLSVV